MVPALRRHLRSARFGWLRGIWRVRSEDDSSGDVDALIDRWARDPLDERERRLGLIRTSHRIASPVAIGLVAVFLWDQPVVIAIVVLAYALSAAAAVRLGRGTTQMTVLGFVDIAMTGLVASLHPVLWMAALLPVAAAVSMGWMIGALATAVLLIAGVGALGVAAHVVDIEGAWFVLSAYGLCLIWMSRTNLQVHESERASLLSVADLVGSLPVIVWESDAETGKLIRAVGRVESILGYEASEWTALPERKRIHAADLGPRYAALRKARLDTNPVIHESRMSRADGSYLAVREVVRVVEVEGRDILRGVILDVTDERATRVAIDRLAAVVDNQREPLVLIEARRVRDPMVVIETNRAFDILVDRQVGTSGRIGLTELAPWIPPRVVEDLDRMAQGLAVAPIRDAEALTLRGGRVFDIELVELDDSSVAIQFRDVTDRRDATNLMRHQANHDVLTGLPNRSLLFDRLGQALAWAARDGSTVGLMLLDLNQFKEINDTLGHAYGDDLLTLIGARLSTFVRGADSVARLGGDEFALIVPGADEKSLTEIATRVADAVKAPIELGGIDVEVTASIGGVVAPEHGEDPHLLLQRADVAMYGAKRSASEFRLYTVDDDRHSVDRLLLMGELRKLLSGELRVWYQPKIDLRTGRPTGFEALARWEHPRLGLLGPDQFVELCEISGIIGDLTWKVLDAALEAARGWSADIAVAVNVPVRNLYDRNLPERVAAILERHDIAPNRLVLEITEREIMEDHRGLFNVMQTLHDGGVRISIDDFGTGFSSLSHLRRLPIHEIKIDRSFVTGMLVNENDYIIARSIIDLAHNLGHRVVAEGVEDESVAELLRSLGCDLGQGYHFARPAPLDQATEWLATTMTGRIADDELPGRTSERGPV